MIEIDDDYRAVIGPEGVERGVIHSLTNLGNYLIELFSPLFFFFFSFVSFLFLLS